MRTYRESDKSSYILEYRASNLSISAFCRKRNLPTTTFSQWIKKGEHKEVAGSFLPVAISQSHSEVQSASNESRKFIKIELPNGIIVNVPL